MCLLHLKHRKRDPCVMDPTTNVLWSFDTHKAQLSAVATFQKTAVLLLALHWKQNHFHPWFSTVFFQWGSRTVDPAPCPACHRTSHCMTHERRAEHQQPPTPKPPVSNSGWGSSRTGVPVHPALPLGSVPLRAAGGVGRAGRYRSRRSRSRRSRSRRSQSPIPQVPSRPSGLSGGQLPPGGARAGRERPGEPCAEGTASMDLKNRCSSGGGLVGDAMPGLRGRAALPASPLRPRPCFFFPNFSRRPLPCCVCGSPEPGSPRHAEVASGDSRSIPGRGSRRGGRGGRRAGRGWRRVSLRGSRDLQGSGFSRSLFPLPTRPSPCLPPPLLPSRLPSLPSRIKVGTVALRGWVRANSSAAGSLCSLPRSPGARTPTRPPRRDAAPAAAGAAPLLLALPAAALCPPPALGVPAGRAAAGAGEKRGRGQSPPAPPALRGGGRAGAVVAQAAPERESSAVPGEGPPRWVCGTGERSQPRSAELGPSRMELTFFGAPAVGGMGSAFCCWCRDARREAAAERSPGGRAVPCRGFSVLIAN